MERCSNGDIKRPLLPMEKALAEEFTTELMNKRERDIRNGVVQEVESIQTASMNEKATSTGSCSNGDIEGPYAPWRSLSPRSHAVRTAVGIIEISAQRLSAGDSRAMKIEVKWNADYGKWNWPLRPMEIAFGLAVAIIMPKLQQHCLNFSVKTKRGHSRPVKIEQGVKPLETAQAFESHTKANRNVRGIRDRLRRGFETQAFDSHFPQRIENVRGIRDRLRRGFETQAFDSHFVRNGDGYSRPMKIEVAFDSHSE
ncbi:hypothetical protein C8R43DRAFT_961566 [Mycena crocata]|nr:hypothetical protein C8R43DRAFT_961566 [Mycena crocata]